jgi:hypothetical protein
VLRPELSEAMAAVVDRLLEPDPDRRFLNASDALDAIAALGVASGQRSLAALMGELYPNQGSVVTPRLSSPTPIHGAAGAAALGHADTISLNASALAGPNGTELAPRAPPVAPPPAPVAAPIPVPPPAPRRWPIIALGVIAFLAVMSTVALASYMLAQRDEPAPSATAPSAPAASPAPTASRPEPPAEPLRAAPSEPVAAPPPPAAPAPAPATASLSVVPIPWGRITVDGRAVSPRQWVTLPAGPHPGRHQLTQRHDLHPRPGAGLRRLGGPGLHRLELARGAALLFAQ